VIIRISVDIEAWRPRLTEQSQLRGWTFVDRQQWPRRPIVCCNQSMFMTFMTAA
jgi:hypothetical protein